jgi:predicted transcriptional regulator
MTKRVKARNANRPSVQAMVKELVDLGLTKEDIASELQYTAWAVRSWLLNDVRPHQTISDKIEAMLKRARAKKST